MALPIDSGTPNLQAVIDTISGWESPWSRDTRPPWGIHDKDPAPYNRLYGPVHPRGGVAGVIHHRGALLAQWGDVHRADLTFSVAKTYLALLAGLAHDDGLLPDLHEPVVRRCPGIGFEGERHARITWHHMLQQTSEWEGTCLGIPEQVDRNRWLDYQGGPAPGVKGDPRPLGEPGSRYEYNDVRINQLSLALLHLWKRPLPEVFAERILQPLHCQDQFRWEGYEQGWTLVDGRRLMSVPGGSHWGGGVSVSALDQSRIGQMLMHGGRVDGRQVLSSDWIARMQQPCPVAPYYGYLVWLNQGGHLFAAAPRSSWFAIGAGSSLTWIDAEHELVCVLRWIDPARSNDCIACIMAAIESR
ncbi:MAG: serine hydrolase [Rhodoferax sp.]|nr:serine hydrolase [Rhodoferax sp.]